MISLSRKEIEALIDLPQAVNAIEQAYRATSLGKVNLPPVGHITFPKQAADCHIKFGHMDGDGSFVIKVATGFPENAKKGEPSGNGLVLVMSAYTGKVLAVLHDEMRLTDIRTGLGGAIASRTLARADAKNLLVIGTGPQAKCQIEAHQVLLPELDRITLWGRNPERAEKIVQSLSETCKAERAKDLEAAVRNADIIVTATGSTKPLIKSDWVEIGTHITSVGADAPGKQELEVDLVARANILIVDSVSQCVDHGEVSHAVKALAIKTDELIELGAILEDHSLGRSREDQISIADLTGIAAQDIAIANAILNSWQLQNTSYACIS